ncbi:MAG: hypothetical protein IPO90_07930 [Flavobacteriales bacterium]|nr:hypothetical protein [Flavobacteriales bacterium]
MEMLHSTGTCKGFRRIHTLAYSGVQLNNVPSSSKTLNLKCAKLIEPSL